MHLGRHLSTQGKQLPFGSAMGAEQVKGVPDKPPLAPQSPRDSDKECLGEQRADRVVSASRVAEKLVCMAAKPAAPWGREDGEKGAKREGQGNGDPP